MTTLVIVLRLIHIIGGVFWVGTALAMAFFVAPTVGATAEAGQKFMSHLLTQTRFTLTLIISGVSTVLAGFALYWINSAGLTLRGWMESGTGMAFGIGGVFALFGLHFGLKVPRIGAALRKLAAQIQGAPTPEQMSQIQALRNRQARVSTINLVCLIIATILMSIARYLHF